MGGQRLSPPFFSIKNNQIGIVQMKKKTYGTPYYMDWVAQIKAGSATVRVHFTGGTLSVYGVTPAEYTTSNEFIQTVIEQSQYFKNGRITLLKSVDIADTKPTVAKSAAKPAKAKATAQSASKIEAEETEVESPTLSDAADPTESEEKATGTEEEESATEDSGEAEVETEGLLKVEVSCLQDAQDYLQQNYGISSYKVRTRATAQQAAREHGVEFVGVGFVSAGVVTEGAEGTETI